MAKLPIALFVALSALAAPLVATAGDLDPKSLHTSIERGLHIVQKAARNYPKHRSCFSCHHQTLPMLAMNEARAFGVDIDEPLLESQLQFIRDDFEDRLDRVRDGKSVGGRSLTAAYALWSFELAAADKDEFSDAFVAYLLKQQKEGGHWDVQTNRPPSEESKIHTTLLASYYMEQFARGEEREREVERAVEKAGAWLRDAEANSQEDHNAKYQALLTMGGSLQQVTAARKAILDAQHEDGGWSQLAGMESDAYATGQTLYFLAHATPSTERDAALDSAIRRGAEFLLRTQEEDGSWFVKSRSKPIQKLFDNGDPHGENQFISIAATGWAVAALASADLQLDAGSKE